MCDSSAERREIASWILAASCGLVLSLAGAAATAAQDVPVEYTTNAIDLAVPVTPGPAPRSGVSVVQITIDRWSTAEERDKLTAALPKGNEVLLAALQAAPAVGTIRTPDSLPWTLRYAHQAIAPDGSRHIFIATDRVIRLWEETYRTHSVNYPFVLIELQVDKDGNGEGKLLIASHLVANQAQKRIEIENYSTEAVLLEHVRRDRK